MGFFAQQTRTIPLDESNSITITKPSFGKRQDMLTPAVKFDAESKSQLVNGAIIQRESLCTYITSWSGPGFEGMPCTRENILLLESDIADKVLKAIEDFDKPLSDEEKKA